MISIITAVYNCDKFVAKTIESVLSQTFTDWEYIIVDDGSTDKTKEVIEKYLYDKRIKYFYQENSGISSARNRAISESKGECIALIDGDDLCLPARIEKEHEFLLENQSCVIVGSNAKIVDENGNFLYETKVTCDWYNIKMKLPKMPFINSSIMFRKEFAVAIGGYSIPMSSMGEDVVFVNMMAMYGELRNIDEPLIIYRIRKCSDGSHSRKLVKQRDELAYKFVESSCCHDDEIAQLKKKLKTKHKKFTQDANYYLHLGKIFLEQNFDRKRAIRNIVISIRCCPFMGISWFNLILCFLPRVVIKRLKRRIGE